MCFNPALANMYLVKAITIAIRHSASRKQFGPEDSGEEIPVLEYQSQVRPNFGAQ